MEEKTVKLETHQALLASLQEQRDRAMNEACNLNAEIKILRKENETLKAQLENVVPIKDKK